MVLGITGGVGSGKSTVLEYLKERHGAYVILCDDVARQLQEPGQACFLPMVKLLGRGVLGPDGRIDRREAARLVFSDDSVREKLNAIVHPAVKDRVRELIAEHEDNALIVIEAALLLDDHYDELCDEIWYIYADEETRRRRLRLGRGYSDEKITQIIRSQRTDESFRALTDRMIDNSSEIIQNTLRQVDEALSLMRG